MLMMMVRPLEDPKKSDLVFSKDHLWYNGGMRVEAGRPVMRLL